MYEVHISSKIALHFISGLQFFAALSWHWFHSCYRTLAFRLLNYNKNYINTINYATTTKKYITNHTVCCGTFLRHDYYLVKFTFRFTYLAQNNKLFLVDQEQSESKRSYSSPPPSRQSRRSRIVMRLCNKALPARRRTSNGGTCMCAHFFTPKYTLPFAPAHRPRHAQITIINVFPVCDLAVSFLRVYWSSFISELFIIFLKCD